MRLLTDATERLDAHEYPASTAELIAAYGDLELDFPEGSETLGEVLDRAGAETFESPEAARLALYGAVGEAAIGRKGYSDRDPTALGEDGHEQLSF
jgi:hypothetical protein